MTSPDAIADHALLSVSRWQRETSQERGNRLLYRFQAERAALNDNHQDHYGATLDAVRGGRWRMAENEKDTARAFAAAKEIIDGRDPSADCASILVTAEHAFAAVLLAVMNRDPRKAAAMLNEGLVQGVEQRLALYAFNTGGHHG